MFFPFVSYPAIVFIVLPLASGSRPGQGKNRTLTMEISQLEQEIDQLALPFKLSIFSPHAYMVIFAIIKRLCGVFVLLILWSNFLFFAHAVLCLCSFPLNDSTIIFSHTIEHVNSAMRS